jgi:hypothetical protein
LTALPEVRPTRARWIGATIKRRGCGQNQCRGKRSFLKYQILPRSASNYLSIFSGGYPASAAAILRVSRNDRSLKRRARR